MNTTTLARCAIIPLLFAFAGVALAQSQTNYGERVPTPEEIIEQLKADTSSTTGDEATRALRPGAATQAVPAAAAAPAQPASISMQVRFDFGSDVVSAASRSSLDNLAQAMKSAELANRSFTVIGHTDAVGSHEVNQALSERRAAAVKRYLESQGVPASRMTAAGRGKTQLLNTSDPNAAENRRVEIQASGG